jgi:hypothetical protein
MSDPRDVADSWSADLADDETPAEARTEPVDAADLAYRGNVIRYAAGSASGVVRAASGREIPFDLEHVWVLGDLLTGPRRYAIAVGQEVGFDVGWTSRGLRVTKLFPVA